MIEKLLKLMDRETKNEYLNSDRALFHLLTRWKERLPNLDDYFHKAFRQVDVTDDGHTDMAIWNLLNGSKLFWRLFEQVQEEKVIMMLLDKIKNDLKQAMLDKDKDIKNALRLVLGEVPRLNKKAGEKVTDEEMIKIITKLIKSENLVMEYSGQEESTLINILNKYLPKMMSEDEIKEWILTNIDLLPNVKMKAMGQIMKSLKGKADGNTVKKVLMSL